MKKLPVLILVLPSLSHFPPTFLNNFVTQNIHKENNRNRYTHNMLRINCLVFLDCQTLQKAIQSNYISIRLIQREDALSSFEFKRWRWRTWGKQERRPRSSCFSQIFLLRLEFPIKKRETWYPADHFQENENCEHEWHKYSWYKSKAMYRLIVEKDAW